MVEGLCCFPLSLESSLDAFEMRAEKRWVLVAFLCGAEIPLMRSMWLFSDFFSKIGQGPRPHRSILMKDHR